MLSIHRKRRKLVHYIVVAGIHYIFQKQKECISCFCKKSSTYPIYKIPSYDIIDKPETRIVNVKFLRSCTESKCSTNGS